MRKLLIFNLSGSVAGIWNMWKSAVSDISWKAKVKDRRFLQDTEIRSLEAKEMDGLVKNDEAKQAGKSRENKTTCGILWKLAARARTHTHTHTHTQYCTLFYGVIKCRVWAAVLTADQLRETSSEACSVILGRVFLSVCPFSTPKVMAALCTVMSFFFFI